VLLERYFKIEEFPVKERMNFDNIYTQIGHDLEKIGVGRETLMRFSKCSGNSHRISFVLGLELVRASFHEPLHLAKQEFLNYSKSEIQSTSHRVEGDGYYQKKLNWKAICFYNRSLLVGKDETLALTYANRSAVFYDTADWLHSLRDIQLSLDHGYPKHLEYKLRERQGDCWLELGQVNQALISFNLARDLLMNLPTLQQKDKLGDLVLKLKQTKNKQKKAKKCGLPDNDKISSIKSIEQEIIKKRRSAPELHRARNPLLPSASASVELINTPDRGRCLVATEDIKIGNISLPACPRP
jgi:SET and MYND domain-containing protein